MSDSITTNDFTLSLSEPEKALILGLLESSLGDTRVEVRHTRTPDFHDHLLEREQVLKTLISRIKAMG